MITDPTKTGRGFNSRWGHWDFSNYLILSAFSSPCDHSIANRNEYQGTVCKAANLTNRNEYQGIVRKAAKPSGKTAPLCRDPLQLPYGTAGNIRPEREGFEPSEPVRAQRFSRPSDSTALASLQCRSPEPENRPPDNRHV